jgi:hypothetical protein
MVHLALEDIDRALKHFARCGDDVEVGLIGTLRVSHVGQLNKRIHVRVFDVTVLVGRRIARLVPDLKV